MELAYYFYTSSMFSWVFRWLSMLYCSIDLTLEGHPRKGSILRWCIDMNYIKMIGGENAVFPWDPFYIVMSGLFLNMFTGPQSIHMEKSFSNYSLAELGGSLKVQCFLPFFIRQYKIGNLKDGKGTDWAIDCILNAIVLVKWHVSLICQVKPK